MALKWVALFGLVVALGVGSAVAQTTGITITGPSNNTVNEGGIATYTVTVRGYVGPAAGDLLVANNPTAFTVSLTTPTATGTASATTSVGEVEDLNQNLWVLNASFDPPSNPSTVRRLFTQSKTISLPTLHDNDAEDENFTLAFGDVSGQTGFFVAATGDGTDDTVSLAAANTPNSLTIDDDEAQGYTLTSTTRNPTEGSPITVDLKAAPPHAQLTGTLQVNIDKQSGWTLVVDGEAPASDDDDSTESPTTVTATDATRVITITQTLGDKNRVTDTVIVSAHTGVIGRSTEVASLPIPVADANALQAVTAKVVNADGVVLVPQPSSVAEGESVKIAVMPLDNDDKVTTANEELTITLASSGAADARDFRVSGQIKITTGQNTSNVVDLIMESDEDVGLETLVLDATVAGDPAQGTETKPVAGVLMLEITDATAKRIYPKSEEDAYPLITGPMEEAAGDDGLNPGESFMVPMDELFTLMDGYTATYDASSDGSAVSITERGEVVTIIAEEEGTSKVTITGTSSMASSFAPSQTISNVAHVAFEVMVTDKMLMVTSLTAEPMEIDEGGMSTITANLNRAVTSADGEVMIGLSVVGDGTLDMGSIAIAMGEMSGSAMLTAAEDDDYMDTEVTVVATGSSIDGTMQVTVMVNDLDEAPVDDPTVRAKDGAAEMVAAAIATAAGDADWMVGGMAATVDMSMLFDVDDGVTAAYVGVSSDDAVVKALNSGTMLTLTPMAAGSATITVTGSDADSGSVATVMHDAMVSLQTLVVTVSLSDDMVMEGGSVTLTATANREATEDVMLAVTVTGDTAAVDADEMITISMGDTSGVATVMAVEDDDSANAMVSVVVSGSVLAPAGPASFDISIEDDDPTLSARTQAEVTAVFMTAVAMAGGASGWLPGGDAAMVDMSGLFTTKGDPTVEYMVESSAPDMIAASASGMMLTLTPMDTGDATITVTATDTSGDMYDTAAVMADVTVGVLPLEIMVSPTTAEVDEGGTVEITATANKMVDANVEVMLVRDATSSAVDDDYSLEPRLITIMAGDAMGKTTLTATDDYDVEGNESLTLVARVKDHGDVGTVMVSIMDNDMETTYELSGPMDTNIVEGMEYELTATANQAVHMDTEVMLMRDRAASDAGDDDYSVGSIMIMAGEMSGTTMLMVTEDNMPDAGDGTNMGESLVLIGSVDGMEVGTLEFIIWDAAVPALPIIAQLLLAAFLAFGGYRRYRQR